MMDGATEIGSVNGADADGDRAGDRSAPPEKRRDASDVVRTKRLEIVDDDGAVRVELGTSEAGDSIVRLRDERGTVRAALTIQEDSPRLRLLDTDGRVRLCGILRDGQPGIELLDAAGKPRMVLFLRGTDQNSPDFFFTDVDGEPRFGIALDDAGAITLARTARDGAIAEPLWMSSTHESEDERLV